MKKQANIKLSTNGDNQFDSTGDQLIDLLAQGPDTLLDRNSPNIKVMADRMRALVVDAHNTNKSVTTKIARYFRDRELGQGLKEQALFMIAVLDAELSLEDMQTIMTVQPKGEKGHVSANKIDFLDLARILSWHKFYHGRDAKVSQALRDLFAWAISNSENALEQVLRYKRRGFKYGPKTRAGVLEIIGIVKNNKKFPISHEVIDEYDAYLRPRIFGHNSGAKPVSVVAAEQRAYFLGNLPKGVIPKGISVEQVLCRRDPGGLSTLAGSNRLSPYQLKSNLVRIVNDSLTSGQIDKIVGGLPNNIFPHELFTAARVLCQTDSGKKVSDAWFAKVVEKYKQKVLRQVVVFADVSGSMGGKLSENSDCTNASFATVMSFLAAHVCGHKVFATWDHDVNIWMAGQDPKISELIYSGIRGGCDTDLVKSINSAAEYFAKRGNAPEVLCFISDMQFNQALSYGRTNNASNAVQGALEAYKNKTGVTPQLVFWNVAAQSVPATKQSGILMLGGFSASNIDAVFGAVNETADPQSPITKNLNPESILQQVIERYK